MVNEFLYFGTDIVLNILEFNQKKKKIKKLSVARKIKEERTLVKIGGKGLDMVISPREGEHVMTKKK
jgi:hypothetical protein